MEQRVAALEEAAAHPLITLDAAGWTLALEEVERFREDLEKAVRQPPRVLPPPPLEQRVAALERALASLMHTLVRRGDISINDARAAHGLLFEHLDGEPG